LGALVGKMEGAVGPIEGCTVGAESVLKMSVQGPVVFIVLLSLSSVPEIERTTAGKFTGPVTDAPTTMSWEEWSAQSVTIFEPAMHVACASTLVSIVFVGRKVA
jgi:hypothetical protein